MSQTVLDSTNIGEFLTTGKASLPEALKPPSEDKPETKDEKDEVKASAQEGKAEDPQGDDEESEELTAAEKAELTEKKLERFEKKFERFKRKIDAKHAAMKEAEEFAESQYRERMLAERRAGDLQRELEGLKKPVEKAPEDLEPNETDEKYKDNPKLFWQEWAKWSARQEVKAERDRQAQEEVRRTVEARKEAFSKRLADTAKKYPDFQEVVAAADQPVPPYIAQYIEESDAGGDLGYHFAKHPEVLERLSKLSPIKAIAEIGKLEDKLNAPAEKKADAEPAKTESKPDVKTVEKSRAPEPIKPLNGESSASVHKELKDWTVQDHKDYLAQRKAFQGSRRQRH